MVPGLELRDAFTGHGLWTEAVMSTVRVRRLDGQLDADHYGATSHSTESALFTGYARIGQADPRVETRPCVCGGFVTADPDAPAKGVAQHNSTGRHIAWQANQEGLT
jgi:hypothetical protein